MLTKFRGLTHREVLLFKGKKRWAEFSPFIEYSDEEASNWLAAALSFANQDLPKLHRESIGVNATLPAQDILAFIPGTKHGTREVFDVKLLEEGCKATGAYDLFLAASTGADDDAKKEEAVDNCLKVRTDGASVDIDGDYTETLSRIAANKNAVGVFGLSFYENNTDTLQVATFQGVTPSKETIANGKYRVSRPLYIYVKSQHIGVVPGLKEFVQFLLYAIHK